jgi:12,18-didecarboxysiroheme deacetylase
MIGISRLYCDTREASDRLRYGRGRGGMGGGVAAGRPVVVWNCTRRCNLACVHCYSASHARAEGAELDTAQGTQLIDDLAAFGVPVVLFSGGEPLLREDLTDLAAHAVARGLRAVVSTNGTLITPARAAELRDAGIAYAGVSLDGLAAANDCFRGVRGAFDRAIAGIRACLAAGLKVGLRFTIHRGNVHELGDVFDLIERERIPRACFYHLVYAGRGSRLIDEDLSHDEARETIDLIIDRTASLHARGHRAEVLTVDNHCDGPWLYMRVRREDPRRAAEVLELLKANRGNASGERIGCVSWDGSVHPDQFWRHYSLGNVLERPFGEIWTDESEPLLAKLRRRHEFVKGRCATCRWLGICGGNLRVRAEAASGSLWASDPACYLTDDEIRSGRE